MKELKEMLHKENYTLIVANGDERRCFTNRGVFDIYSTLISDPQFLKGALVADKVIGKAAAAIMVMGGVSEVYTDVISKRALEVFDKYKVKVEYGEIVAYIINRDGSDLCPLELRCGELSDLEEMKLVIGGFLQNMRA